MATATAHWIVGIVALAILVALIVAVMLVGPAHLHMEAPR
jgi:hypothetical protein